MYSFLQEGAKVLSALKKDLIPTVLKVSSALMKTNGMDNRDRKLSIMRNAKWIRVNLKSNT